MMMTMMMMMIIIIIIICDLPMKPFGECVFKKRGTKFYTKSLNKENMLRREMIIMTLIKIYRCRKTPRPNFVR
jgi:hypothetical protein